MNAVVDFEEKQQDQEYENELMQQIRDHVDLLEDVKEERGHLNSKLKASVEDLKSKGIQKEVIAWALQYREADEQKQRVMDLTLMIVRKALGQPMQLDMLQETNAAINLHNMAKDVEQEETTDDDVND